MPYFAKIKTVDAVLVFYFLPSLVFFPSRRILLFCHVPPLTFSVCSLYSGLRRCSSRSNWLENFQPPPEGHFPGPAPTWRNCFLRKNAYPRYLYLTFPSASFIWASVVVVNSLFRLIRFIFSNIGPGSIAMIPSYFFHGKHYLGILHCPGRLL